MKFSDGYWRVGEGYHWNWMSNVERAWTTNDEAKLLLSPPQRHLGDTLNVGTLTATIRAPLQDVIAVNCCHWIGEDDIGPNFALSEEKPKVEIVNTPKESVKFTSGGLELSVNCAPKNLSFGYTGPIAEHYGVNARGRLTGHSARSMGVVTSSKTPKYNVNEGIYATRESYILLQMDLTLHEKIFGLGERFGPVIKNGQAVDLWNEDGGTSSELSYKNVPFYLSSNGYGVFINNPGKIMLEIQSERTTRVNIAVNAENLEYMIISGKTPKEILDKYTRLTGRPGLPPAWSYGLWLSTSFTTPYDEKTVTSFMDGFKSRGIPLTVFTFDAFWMKSFQWCDFEFNEERFGDAAAYLKRLKARGMKLVCWLNPYIAQASPLFAEGKTNGYFIMRADTVRPTVWQWDLWQAGMAIVDFTNPAAKKWYTSHLTKLLDMGIDSFKTDFGERIPFNKTQIKYFDGSDPVRMHNLYSYLFNQTIYEHIQTHGQTNPCLFSRAGTTGSQKFPVHWGGDCESTFEAMAETLRGGLSLAASGFAFWAHDIGGFEGLPHPNLYKRWVQFGLMSSHSRLHGASSYRVPWIYDDAYPGESEKCSQILKDCVLRKLSLMPYLLRVALEGHQKGTPVMRPLFMEFPLDFNAWNVDTEYMLGPDLLVAPVFNHDDRVSYYVPWTMCEKEVDKRKTREHTDSFIVHGQWRDWFNPTSAQAEGQWMHVTHTSETFTLLVRPGAVIPINPTLTTPEPKNIMDGLQLIVNNIQSPQKVEIVSPHQVDKISHTFTVYPDLHIEGAEGVEVIDFSTISKENFFSRFLSTDIGDHALSG